MLGRPAFGHGMYEAEEFLLHDDGRDLAESLAQTLIAQLPADGYRAFSPPSAVEESSAASDRDDFLAAANSVNLPESDRACVNQLLEIYVAAKEVIRLQLQDASVEELKAKQRELSDLYSGFRMWFGPINKNVKKLSPHSPVVPFLKALEIPVGKNLYNRAPIFSERTIRPTRRSSDRCEPKEALLISLNDKGRVDLDYIAGLCQRSHSEALADLGAFIYETPGGEYVTAEEYLSGDVRQKLREAELAAQINPAFVRNAEALRAVQPADLGRDEISVRLGSAWVPEAFVRDFISSLVPSFRGSVKYIPALAVWKIENVSAWSRSSVEATQTWGTSRANAFELIEDILNLRTTTVTDEVQDPNGGTRRVVNDNETIAAQAKQLEIKQRFSNWTWQDDSRAAKLIRVYNERFNAFRKREYDGSTSYLGAIIRTGKLRQSILSILRISAIVGCLSLSAFAQTPSPTPSPAPTSPAGSSLPQFFDKLIGRAGALMPMLQKEIEGPLLPWLENLSWWLAVLVIIFGFARLWRENAGAGADLFWWFGRIAIIFALAGSGSVIVSKLDSIGQEMAWGGSGNSNSVLYRFYNNHRKSFEEGYRRFAKGHFTVEPTGEKLKPPPGGGEAVFGVIQDVVASPKDVNNKFETLSHDMPFLFSVLSFARGILAFGDLYLLALSGFLMIAVRLAAPVMIAMAIDRNLANKISYPFLWGTIVLTLMRSLVQNQETYLGEVVGANERRAQGLTAAEIAGANRAGAGANRGAAVAKGGVDQGYRLDLQSNRITYDGAVKAASQARDASFEAARLRALSTVVSAVGHNVARDMEQGLALRY